MKGLERIPSIQDLQQAYEGFLLNSISVDQLALYSQWTRFDPRLGEIWVKWVSVNWEQVNAIALHDQLSHLPWPLAAAVLLEFVEKTIPTQRRSIYKLWSKTITSSFPHAHFEQFFIGLRSTGGKQMLLDARFSTVEYLKWGYLCREAMFNKATQMSALLFSALSYDKTVRLEILKSITESQARVTSLEYWNAIHRSVSRRQAERDLEQCSFLSPRGRTKGRYFQRKKK